MALKVTSGIERISSTDGRFPLSQNRSHCQTRAASPVSNWNALRNRHSQETQIKAFAARLPAGDYLEMPDAEHELMMERNAIRATFWAAFDGFMKKHRAPE